MKTTLTDDQIQSIKEIIQKESKFVKAEEKYVPLEWSSPENKAEAERLQKLIDSYEQKARERKLLHDLRLTAARFELGLDVADQEMEDLENLTQAKARKVEKMTKKVGLGIAATALEVLLGAADGAFRPLRKMVEAIR